MRQPGPPGAIAAFWLSVLLLAAVTAAAQSVPAPLPRPADPLKLVVVVDDGGQRVSLVDGERMEAIHRFAPRFPVSGAPRFSPDGRFAFFASAEGWIAKYDLLAGAVVKEARAGSAVRSMALSADGRWLLVGNAEPATLELFDAELRPIRSYPAAALDGKQVSSVSAVHDAATRSSFVASFDSLPQLWEISYDPAAAPIFDGLVHDYRMGEAIATPGFLGVRRTPLEAPVDLLAFDGPHRHVLAVPRAVGGAAATPGPVDVINLDIRRRIVGMPLTARASGELAAWFGQGGRPLLALAGPDAVSIVDPVGWRVVRAVTIPGRSVFVRAHPAAAQLWVGMEAADPTQRAGIALVDRETLAVTALLVVPGAAPASMAFTRDGARAMVGLAQGGDALLLYDTRTLALLKRLSTIGTAAAYPVGAP